MSNRVAQESRCPHFQSLSLSLNLAANLPTHPPNPRAVLTEVAWWVAHQTCP